MVDGAPAVIDPQNVERVRFAAQACGRGGTGLDDDRGSPSDVVALGRRPCERDVQMARQKHVDPLAGELLYRFRPGTRAAERRTGVRFVERMMRTQAADDGRGEVLL